ncbi:MAG: hypothetical protein R3E66_00635 [bacterium]
MNRKWLISACVVGAFWSMPASAQVVSKDVTEIVPDGDIKNLDDETRKGFDGTLQIGANLNLASNSNVVGQDDGFSTLFGLSLVGGLDYLYKRHEVRNTLKIQESWARTPVLDEFVKNTDVVELESLYNYFLLDWAGLFGRLSATTALLKSEAVTADPTPYSVTRNDGTVDPTFSTDRLELAGAFSPFTLNESVGAFVEPIDADALKLSIRLGFGARETFADGVLASQDNKDTPEVELIELSNVYQAGAEGFLGAAGKFYDKRINYSVGASVLIPFLTNDDTDRSAMDLARYGLVAEAGTSVFEWMSLNYQFRALKDPQLLDEWQVQHALLLTFNYTFIERDGGVAGPSVEDQLAEAQRQLAEAEARCEEMKEDAAEEIEDAEAAKAEQDAKRLEEAQKQAEEAEAAAKAKQEQLDKLKDGAQTPTEEPVEKPVEEAPKTPEQPTTPQ